jgi:photosystem II stability/assembly factor-like uncharacterized protein
MRLLPLLFRIALALTQIVFTRTAFAQDEPAPSGGRRGGADSSDPINARTFAGLRVRNIGPAFVSGRVSQIAVFPDSTSHYLAAEASGGIWLTRNNGTSWTPVFDNYGSYSIGWIAIDPKNPSIVWVGSGENNDQRSVSFGDGVYKSEDGGLTYRNVGLKLTEHIARIVIDPRDSNVVYVAAPGPLWKGGGERGLYKTTDGGKTWSQSLIKVGDYTGCSDVVMDPKNPDVLFAATHQRERRYFGMIHGGPESALWRSNDAGKTWNKVGGGFPNMGDLGRIGLNYAPSNPSIMYAQVEGGAGRGGLYRSSDGGATWEKRNSYDVQGQYYAKVVVDPGNPDRVYVMNTNIMVSDDGGRTETSLPTRYKHVDNHEIWVDPHNNDHYLVGCDGGIYESFDRAQNWIFKSNLPTAQMYDVAVSEDAPFYYVYGGTQDNNSFGCPARTRSSAGIMNSDCFVTMGGDGFYSRVDPKDPNTIYANMQNGGMVRFDRRTGERVSIQPQPSKGDPAARWNWDAPVIVSPHSNTRLYFGSQKLYRSDDRGDSWRAISPDLTRNLDRNTLPLMGKIWPIDAIQKNVSTALYDNISSIAESPKQEGLIYVGTDDGLLQITEDGGKTWRKVEKPAGVPEDAYVQRITASQHDAGTVYVAYENHQNGDFKPYLIKSTDKGKSWTDISGNLPERGGVYAIAEDYKDPKLLFAGTEFGLYFTKIGGEKWIPLRNGLPTIMVRDLAIQRQMDDLVIGTFGRSIYILDDYSPLRDATAQNLSQESMLFPVKTALSYIPGSIFGGGKGDQGENFFTAPNPPVGAIITYNLKDGYRTKAQERQQRERAAVQRGETGPYPTPEQLRAESEEEAPAVLMTVTDAAGKIVRRIDEPATQGIHRVTWDLRGQSPTLPAGGGGGRGGAGGGGGRGGGEAGAGGGEEEPPAFAGRGGAGGALVAPGRYTVTLAKRIDGVVTPLPGSQTFEVIGEGPSTREDRIALSDFEGKLEKLQQALTATQESAAEARTRLDAIRRAVDATPALSPKLHQETLALEKQLDDINLALRGDTIWRSHNEGVTASIAERVQAAASPVRGTTSHPTKTAMEQYQIASDELAAQIPKLRKLVETDIKALEKQLDAAGAPPTPGRLPDWKPGK